MKRRKSVIESEKVIWEDDRVRIYTLEDKDVIFEVDGDVTLDVAEAVAMMIHRRVDGPWSLDASTFDRGVSPDRCLYWLSGGDREWSLMEHYCLPWFDCCTDICEKWGDSVRAVVQSASTLGDIRDGLRSTASLPDIYDWCIGRGFAR
jgi:hypothetical protein